ncbi:hypothetical protein N9M83_01010 [Candidatus Poseidonia alphae]|nr:hypothetical protein [Candidatus Poseidonia alphae]
MSEWHGVPSTRAEKIPPNDLDKQGAFTSIVREPTQNSTDNCLDPNQPVRIKFSLKLLDAGLIKASYLPQTIWLDHVTTSPFYSANSDRARQANEAVEEWLEDEQIPVLLIEDYNTTGLVGDIELYQHNPQDTPQAEQDNTFYWLLRTLGMSAPTTGRGGSWGLGKLAFPLASRVKTFFAVTSRSVAEERLLLGQALLEYRADRGGTAWWDKMLYYADSYANDAEHHWKPVSDADEIDEFCEAFGVTRSKEDHGTSFIIPYPRNSEDDPVNDISKLMCGVANNYALAIMQDKLVLEFEDEDGGIHIIDKNNFLTKIENDDFDWDSIDKKRRTKINSSYTTKEKMLKVLELFSVMEDDEASDADNCEEFELPSLDGGTQLITRFDEIMPDDENGDFIRLKDGYDNGKFIKIRHNVPVVNSDDSETNGLVEMVFQLCDAGNLDAAEAHYYRSQISLPLVNGKEPLRPGLASLVMVAREEADDLSEMLRQSEGPAHLNWEPAADRLERYRLAPSTVRYIKQLPELIVSRLSSTAAEGVELWRDLFSFGGDEDEEQEGAGEDNPPPPPINRDFTITDLPTNNGFSVIKRDTADSLVGKSYLLRIGYPNPLPLKWNRPPDARLTNAAGDISTWQSSGCGVETITHNASGEVYPDKVKLTIQADDFKLVVNTLENRKKARLKLEDYENKAEPPAGEFTLTEVELAEIEIGEDN